MELFNELITYFKSDKKSIQSMLILTIASSILILGIPFLIQNLIQHYSLLIFQQSTTFLIIMVGIFLSGITLMRVLQMHLSEYFQRRLFLRSIDEAQKYAAHMKLQDRQISRLHWNYVFESISLQKSIVPLIIDGFTFALQAFLILILISIYHLFFVIYSALLGFSFYWVIYIMGKKTLGYALLESTKKHEVLAKLQTEPTSDDLEHYVLDYFKSRHMHYSAYIKQSIGLFIIKIIAAIILIMIGGLLVLQKQMTIGQLIASELIVTNLLISLFKFSNLLGYFYDSAASVKKLNIYTKDLK